MKKRILYFLFSALLATSCQGLTELNRNPTKSPDVEPSLLITTAQFMPSQGQDETRYFWIYPGGWVNNWTGEYNMTTYGGGARINTRLFDRRPWRYMYQQVIRPIMIAVDRTKDNPDLVNVYAAARLVKAENFLLLTDYYGDIPYSDVFKVYYDGTTVDPRYDRQEEIYKNLLKECREAVASFDTTKPGLEYDLYFDGDVAKWKKFGASLWLRIAMRLVRVEPELARTETEAAIAAGVMEGNDDTALVRHEGPRSLDGSSNGYANYMYQSRDPERTDGTSAFQLTQEMVEALEGDPRVTILARNYLKDGTDITEKLYEATGVHTGQPAQSYNYSNRLPEITLPDGTVVTRFARYLTASNWVTAPDAPFIHLSYAETEFLRAEAALNGWAAGGTVEEHYCKGLIAAIKQWEVFGAAAQIPDDAALEALAGQFLAQYITGHDRTDKLEEINKQLWILHAMNPVECWSNIRRTGMPSRFIEFKNLRPGENESDGKRPNRVYYPVDEQKKNAANYKEALDRMGGKDDWLHPMWWQNGEYK